MTTKPVYFIGDQVLVGSGKIVWTITEFWNAGNGTMVSLTRADLPSSNTSVRVERLRPVVA